jgi:Transposase IS4
MGVLILITRFEFGSRASLWSTTARNRFIPAPNFGHTTGMSRERFDLLWRYMVWSEQPKERPEGMSHEEFRWALVQDFVTNFNDHRETYYYSSSLICADESISRWYGLGGNWINMGLPHYVAMDRKPEHGCEIQNCCDGVSGIMMQLKLVKSQAAEAATNEQQRAAAAEADAT